MAIISAGALERPAVEVLARSGLGVRSSIVWERGILRPAGFQT